MNASEACQLAADLTLALSATRRERDANRLLAQQAIRHAHDLHVELDRLRARHERLSKEYGEYRATTITDTQRAA